MGLLTMLRVLCFLNSRGDLTTIETLSFYLALWLYIRFLPLHLAVTESTWSPEASCFFPTQKLSPRHR